MRKYNFFEIEINNAIAIVYLNKPETRNAMSWDFWMELPDVIQDINENKDVRAFVIAGKGKSFSTGLDVLGFTTQFEAHLKDNSADDRKIFYNLILKMQSGINAVYQSNKPSIAVIQKHCIGGGLDLISACDIRYASEDAIFSLREAKVAIVADMGSINRLPSIIGEGNTRELALTGKDIDSKEALRMGLINKILPDHNLAMEEAIKVAIEISENPSIVVEGIKEVMRYSEGKPLDAGLNYVCVWNSSFLASKDFSSAIDGFKNKKRPTYNQ
jgi:enoyl-CoA hydratase